MGLSYDDFWRLTPRKLNVILDGYKLRRKTEDEKNWILGGYIFEAVSLAMGNAFRKKNQKPKSYFEILDKPFFTNINNVDGMPEEEIQKKRELLMAQLRTKQSNFELKHGK